jgi:ABC-type glycerol-3-phosphate transport system substrate-binding protein
MLKSALALVPAASAACGLGSQPRAAGTAGSAPVTLTFGTDWSSGPRGEIMKQALAGFAQQHPTITLERHDIGDDYYTRLSGDFAAGTQDDVTLFDGPVFDHFRRQNAFVELTALLKANKVDAGAYTRVDPVFAPDGKRYGMPFQLTFGTWLVNQTLFARAGLKQPAETWTWNEWADAARALTNAEAGQYGLGPTLNQNLQVSVLPLILSNGGHHVSADMKQTLLTAPPAMEAIRWVADRIVKDRSWVPLGERGATFAAGNVAMAYANTGAIGSQSSGLVQSVGAKFEWDLMPQPRAPRTGRSVTNFNEQPYVITAKHGAPAARVEAGFAVLLHLAGREVQTLIARHRGSTPVLKELIAGPPYADAPPAGMGLVSKVAETAADTRFFAGYLEWRDAYGKELNDVWSSKIAVDAGIQKANEAGNAVLNRLR